MYQKREVNATTEKSSWRVIPFAPFVPESDLFLKAGDVIRMFHKEAEGYLTNELPDDDFVDEDAEKEKPVPAPGPQSDEGAPTLLTLHAPPARAHSLTHKHVSIPLRACVRALQFTCSCSRARDRLTTRRKIR
jgi:hypothetical protein